MISRRERESNVLFIGKRRREAGKEEQTTFVFFSCALHSSSCDAHALLLPPTPNPHRLLRTRFPITFNAVPTFALRRGSLLIIIVSSALLVPKSTASGRSPGRGELKTERMIQRCETHLLMALKAAIWVQLRAKNRFDLAKRGVHADSAEAL